MLAALLSFLGTVIDLLVDVVPIAAVLIGFPGRDPAPSHHQPGTGGFWPAVRAAGAWRCFLEGLELALFPLGRLMAEQLTAPAFLFGEGVTEIGEFGWADYYWVYIFAAAIGFATTVAEPALIAVSIKANQVSGGTITVNGPAGCGWRSGSLSVWRLAHSVLSQERPFTGLSLPVTSW